MPNGAEYLIAILSDLAKLVSQQTGLEWSSELHTHACCNNTRQPVSLSLCTNRERWSSIKTVSTDYTTLKPHQSNFGLNLFKGFCELCVKVLMERVQAFNKLLAITRVALLLHMHVITLQDLLLVGVEPIYLQISWLGGYLLLFNWIVLIKCWR